MNFNGERKTLDGLMRLVFQYGAARCDVDRINTAWNNHHCNNTIDAIRSYAQALIEQESMHVSSDVHTKAGNAEHVEGAAGAASTPATWRCQDCCGLGCTTCKGTGALPAPCGVETSLETPASGEKHGHGSEHGHVAAASGAGDRFGDADLKPGQHGGWIAETPAAGVETSLKGGA
jgi:hypothetical protein